MTTNFFLHSFSGSRWQKQINKTFFIFEVPVVFLLVSAQNFREFEQMLSGTFEQQMVVIRYGSIKGDTQVGGKNGFHHFIMSS